MTSPLFDLAAADAVEAYVVAKLAGQTDLRARAAARDLLVAPLQAVFDQPGMADKWKALSLPLSDVAVDVGRVQLALLLPTPRPLTQVGDLKWGLRADVAGELTIDVLGAEQLDALGLVPRDGHQLVRYALHGALQAETAGSARSGLWSVSAQGQASADATLAWTIAAPSHRRLGEALLAALPFMAAPMSLADQLERAGDFDYWGASVDLAGALSASFSAGATLERPGWTMGFEGERVRMGFSAGLSGQVAMQIGGAFRVCCLTREAGRTAGGDKVYGIEVVVERQQSRSQALALELSAGIDASALASAADAYLQSQLPPSVEPDALLDALTRPGTVRVAEIRAGLAHTLAGSNMKDLVSLATGFGDPQVLASELAARAAGPLADEIDKLAATLGTTTADATAGKSAAVQAWLGRAFAGVRLAPEQRAALQDFAVGQLNGAGGLAEGALVQLAQRLQGRSLAAATALLQPLAALGDLIQAELGAVAEVSAGLAQTAVAAGQARYVALRAQVLSAFSDAQRAKVALAAAASLEESAGSQVFLRLTFVPAGDLAAAQRLYQALWNGHLADLPTLLEDARRSGALYGEPEGWLTRVAGRVSKLSLHIGVFGVDIGQTLVKTTELQLKADLAGNVIASGAGQVDAAVSNYWNERDARLSVAVRMGTGDGSSRVPEIWFNGAYSAMGRGMDRELFEAMQRTLVRVAGGQGVLDLRALLQGIGIDAQDDDAFRAQVGFLLPIALSADEGQAFLDATDAQLQRAVTRYGLRALDGEYEGRWRSGLPSTELLELARCVGGSFADQTEQLTSYLKRFPRRWPRNASTMSSAVYAALGLETSLMKRNSPLHRDLGVYCLLSRLVAAIVELRDACRALARTLSASGLQNLAEVHDKAGTHLRAAADAMAAFSVPSLTLIGNDEKVAWPFATFAAVLADTVGRKVPPGFVACAVLKGREDRPIPLISA